MWRELEPRASRLWVRFAPRRWPAPQAPWLDLVERRIVWPGESRSARSELPPIPPAGDVVLLPPLEKARTREKQELLSACVENGGTALDQLIAGADTESKAERERAHIVLDALSPLLEGGRSPRETATPSSIALVPLLPGVSARESEWSPILDALLSSPPLAVAGIAPELTPLDRRRLVERLGEQSFEQVHHSRLSISELERRFARAVHAAGLNPFFERPAPRGLSPRAERNRRIAAVLFEAGERWLALGRGESDAASLLAAGRHVESATQEIEALARERQLGLLPWMAPLARQTVATFVESGRSGLLEELRAEWVGERVTA